MKQTGTQLAEGSGDQDHLHAPQSILNKNTLFYTRYRQFHKDESAGNHDTLTQSGIFPELILSQEVKLHSVIFKMCATVWTAPTVTHVPEIFLLAGCGQSTALLWATAKLHDGYS